LECQSLFFAKSAFWNVNPCSLLNRPFGMSIHVLCQINTTNTKSLVLSIFAVNKTENENTIFLWNFRHCVLNYALPGDQSFPSFQFLTKLLLIIALNYQFSYVAKLWKVGVCKIFMWRSLVGYWIRRLRIQMCKNTTMDLILWCKSCLGIVSVQSPSY